MWKSGKRKNSDQFQVMKLLKMSTNFIKKFNDSPNVYERHKPKCIDLLERMMNDKLSEIEYPTSQLPKYYEENSGKKKTYFIFMLGGATYAESRELKIFAEQKNINIFVGTNFVLNSKV